MNLYQFLTQILSVLLLKLSVGYLSTAICRPQEKTIYYSVLSSLKENAYVDCVEQYPWGDVFDDGAAYR